MNQEQIEEYLNNMLEQSESDIDKVFANRLKALLDLLAEMHRKYSDGKEISRTEIYKYHRFEKELERIKEMFHADYQEIFNEINSLMKAQYLDNYLRSAYVYEMTATMNMGYQIPSAETIMQAITNPIAELRLPQLMTQHRNEIIRRIRIELAQGIEAGESYSQMATRLEKAVKFSRSKARTVARTEAGRSQTLGRLNSLEHAEEYVKGDRFWMAELDHNTRKAHRQLDGQKAGKDKLFEYKGMKSVGPSLWGVPSMDINCRCDVGLMINGEYPSVRRVRNYTDADYQHRLAERIEELMSQGLTEKSAERRAKREVFPPNKVVEYQDYNTWLKDLGKEK